MPISDTGGTDDLLDFSEITVSLEFAISSSGITVTQDEGATFVVSGGGMIENLGGGAADDTFVLADGVDLGGFIHGGDGVNTLDYSDWNTSVTVNLSVPDDLGTEGTATGTTGVSNIRHVKGGWAADTITGNREANWLRGGTGDDTLRGLSGDDTLEGGPGADVLEGGYGSDTASYENAGGAVTVDLTLAEQAWGSGEATPRPHGRSSCPAGRSASSSRPWCRRSWRSPPCSTNWSRRGAALT